ncbi:MAG: M24 family metallopeptidase [bacterium]
MFEDRRRKFRHWMAREKIGGFLIHSTYNRFYLSGFMGSEGYLFITQREVLLIVDFRYSEKAAKFAGRDLAVETTAFSLGLEDFALNLVKKRRLKRVGFEAHLTNFGEYERWKSALGRGTLIPTSGAVERLRAFKSKDEITLIEKACKILGAAYAHVYRTLKPGVTEREAAIDMEHFIRTHGAQNPAFNTIFISGKNTSMPHGTPGDKVIKENDLITVDAGVLAGGYCSDVTRTFFLGEKVPKEVREVYRIVEEAQARAGEAIRAGVTGRDADAAARNFIARAGFEKAFGHGLGHGIGLEVHESPRLSALSKDTLQAGMVVTNEPGIYLPGKFGVRIEDIVVVERNGIRNLTSFIPKRLEV